jgi:hypothetical protein
MPHSYSTVKRLACEFKQGREAIEDKQRPGRPIVMISPENVDLIRSIINKDPYITYDQMEEETDLSRFTLHTTIHQYLGMKKITSRWVPHNLTPKNKQDRVNIFKAHLEKFESESWRLYDVVTGFDDYFGEIIMENNKFFKLSNNFGELIKNFNQHTHSVNSTLVYCW